MEEKSYLIPMIDKIAKKQWVSGTLIRNPRISEINDIAIRLAEKTGNMPFYDKLSSAYEYKLAEYVEYYVSNPTFLEIDQNGEIQINMPEYINSMEKETKKEIIRYQNQEQSRVLRTRYRQETKQARIQLRLDEVSTFDENGIEIERNIKREEGGEVCEKHYVRSDEFPHIIIETDKKTGQTTYFDIRKSKHFENLDLDLADQIQKEEITSLTQVEKIRIAEQKRNSAYGKSIQKLLGIENKKGQEWPNR